MTQAPAAVIVVEVHQVVLQGHPLGHHPVAQEVHHVHLHHPAHLAVAAVTMAVQGLRKKQFHQTRVHLKIVVMLIGRRLEIDHQQEKKKKSVLPLSNDKAKIKEKQERSPGRKKRERSPPPRPTRIHIGRLTLNVTRDHIHEIFSTYGTVKSIEFPMDRLHPHNGRGYAYVEFNNADEAENAMKHMDGGQIDGQEITAAPVLVPSRPRRSSPRPLPPRHGPRRHSPPRYRRRSPPVRRRSPPRRRRSRSRSPRPATRRRRSRSSSSSSR